MAKSKSSVASPKEKKKMNHSGRVQQKSKDKGNSSALIGQGRFTVAVASVLYFILFFYVTEREIDATPATPSTAEVNSSVLPFPR